MRTQCKANNSKAALGRREFLGGMAASAAPLLAGATWTRVVAAEPASGGAAPIVPGLIVREREPLNLEMPFAALRGRITPDEQFYIRSHFAIPKLDVAEWRLAIEGAVERPFEISYDELRQMPATTITATLECAGNSRAMLVPKASGLLWQLGAVGNAKWTGVRLADVLEKAGIR